MKTQTYFAVYRKSDQSLPVALFRDELDQQEWHANPGVFENCRRRVIISPTPEEMKKATMHHEAEAIRLLRAILTCPDEDCCRYLEEAQEFLKSLK